MYVLCQSVIGIHMYAQQKAEREREGCNGEKGGGRGGGMSQGKVLEIQEFTVHVHGSDPKTDTRGREKRAVSE